ncbi:MAG TPA: 6-bladed beta-propeller [Puia sp.]|nr:6-bladed beta-propeller [Puia sp.]
MIFSLNRAKAPQKKRDSTLLCVLVGLIVALAFSCTSPRSGVIVRGDSIIINLDSKANHLSLSHFVDSVSIVNLESTPKSIISEASGIQKILYIYGKYFILDGKYMSIKVFGADGRYLYDIGKLGLGKAEFDRIENMEYDSLHNSLMVLCNRPSKLSEFALDGRLIKESELKFFSTAFAIGGPNSRIFYVNQNESDLSGKKNILFTDSLNEIKFSMFDFPSNIKSGVKFSGGLYSTNGQIFFNPAFSNTFYTLSNDTAKPLFVIDYKSKNVPKDIPEEKLRVNLSKYSFQYSTFIKFDGYIGFNYRSDYVSSAFYNLKTHDILTSDLQLDSLNFLFTNFMFQSEDFCIMTLDLRRLSAAMKYNQRSIKTRFPNVFSHINFEIPYPNPALLIFKLKSNF